MEVKDVLAYLGIEGVENIDAFKEKFHGKFGVKSEIPDVDKIKSEIIGKTLGPVQTRIKSLFGISAEEEKTFSKWEDYVEFAHKKVKAKEEELTELSLKSSDGQLKELNEKIEKLNKSKDEYKSAAQQAQEALQAKEQEFAGKFKAFKTESVLKDSFLKVQPKLASLSKAEQFYMDNLIKENLVIDFDENDHPIVLNKEGKRWTDPNKAGAFLSPDAVIEAIAAENNFIKKNDAGDRKPLFGGATTPSNQQSNNNERQLHPSAQKAAAVQKAS